MRWRWIGSFIGGSPSASHSFEKRIRSVSATRDWSWRWKVSVARSCISSATAMSQPWPSLPTMFSRGTRTSSRKTSLNSLSPFICRSGRTSTPGTRMSMMNIVMPLCLGTSGFGAREQDAEVGVLRVAGPDLLAVDHVRVAVEHGARRERREVGARAGLAVALAPDLLGREDRFEVAPLLLLGAVRDDAPGRPC